MISFDKQKKHSRRVLLKGALAAGSATFGFPAITRAQSNSLVVVSGGGSYEEAFKKAVIEPFQKETGIKVTYASPATEAKLKAQVDSGVVQWDLVELPSTAFRSDAAKYLEEIDYGAFDKETKEGLLPEAKQKFGVGSYVFSTVMGFSTAEYPASKPRPQSWADFWDAKKYPGPRSLRAGAIGDPTTIEFALLAAGVPKDKLYPIDFDKAFAALDKIKGEVTKFWNVGAEPNQMLSDRQVAMCSVFNGRIEALKAQGAAVDYTWNEGEMSPLYWSVPKGSKNKVAAMKFAAYVSSAQAQARLNNIIYYGPMNKAAFKYIDPKIAPSLPTNPANLEKQFFRNLAFWEAKTPNGKTNTEILVDRWVKWAST